MQHGSKELYINDRVAVDPRENAEDTFAADSLMLRVYDAVTKGIRRADDIKALAEQLGVTPGIVPV